MSNSPLYNTNGLPEFVPPATESEARTRITELNMAILSIEDQIKTQEITNGIDPAWFRKASTSRRFKTFELQRLKDWVEDKNSRGVSLSDHIVDIVRADYNDDEWADIYADARMRAGI
jgi:hypothetical protein